MELLNFIKNSFDIHPFILEVLKLEGMGNYHAWGELGENLHFLDEVVRQRPTFYPSLPTYFQGQIEHFSLKIADKLLLKKIEIEVMKHEPEYFIQPVTKKPDWKNKYPLLKLLVEHCVQNKTQFDPELKKLGLYLFIKCGPSAYNFLRQSFPLPSKQTVKNELSSIENIVEGELRVDRLLQHLSDHKLPKVVWLSEDATRCVSKVGF